LIRIYAARDDLNPRLQIENALPAIVMSASMFEAVVNLVLHEGYKDRRVFTELESSTPIAK